MLLAWVKHSFLLFLGELGQRQLANLHQSLQNCQLLQSSWLSRSSLPRCLSSLHIFYDKVSGKWGRYMHQPLPENQRKHCLSEKSLSHPIFTCPFILRHVLKQRGKRSPKPLPLVSESVGENASWLPVLVLWVSYETWKDLSKSRRRLCPITWFD